MTDKAVSALTSLTGANTATGDLLYIVDISEAAAADRSKKITAQELQNYLKAFPATIGVGGATPAASGAGISFPATASASSDANTLDDYEEGTFTPTVGGATTAGVTTYNAQTGIYTKIGRQVTVVIYVDWSAMTGTGSLVLSSLPFSSANIGNQNYSVCPVLVSELNWSGGTSYIGLNLDNTSIIRFGGCSDDAAIVDQLCVNEPASIRLTLTYFAS